MIETDMIEDTTETLYDQVFVMADENETGDVGNYPNMLSLDEAATALDTLE